MTNPTIEDLEQEYLQLNQEVEKIKAIIEASDTSTFEIFIQQIKEEMVNNVKEEDFKALRQNKSKVEKFREIIKIIQNQTKLLEQKTAEMEDLKWKIDHFQQPLPLETKEEAEDTGYIFDGVPEGMTIQTGDVFKNKTSKIGNDNIYYLVKKSVDIKDSFALISNFFDGERCLQYPNNFKILDNAKYIGNVFEENPVQEAIKALALIADFQENTGN